MGKYQIAKEFALDYGHRVWTQKLNTEFSLDCALACRHLHGHRGTVIVYLEAEELNDAGMVTDFKHLNFFKKFIDDVLDHKMVLDINDPLNKLLLLDYITTPVRMEIAENSKTYASTNGYVINNIQYHPQGYWTLNNWEQLEEESLREMYEGIVLVPFVPTSENLSKWLLDVLQKKMDEIGVIVQRVQFFETPKSQSNYII